MRLIGNALTCCMQRNKPEGLDSVDSAFYAQTESGLYIHSRGAARTTAQMASAARDEVGRYRGNCL
jgi:hypothetical protein